MVWLVTGAGGQLGSVVMRQLSRLGIDAVGTVSPAGAAPEVGRVEPLELRDADALAALWDRVRPSHLVHAAAVTSVAAAYADPARARAVNVEATARLARLADRDGVAMAYTSTDMVFDGEHAPYAEDAVPAPVTIYGRTKAAGEEHALQHGAAVLRMPLMYGLPATRRTTFFAQQLAALRAGERVTLFHDEHRSPLWLEDGARSVIAAVEARAQGIFHLGGPERLSRAEMGRLLARALGASNANFHEVSRTSVGGDEPRQRDLSLRSQRFERRFGTPPGRPMGEALQAMDLRAARA